MHPPVGHWIGKWSLCLIVSVQTSLTTPVHFMEDTLCTPPRGVFKRKEMFPLCNIKLLCISLLPVYFIKVLQIIKTIWGIIGKWRHRAFKFVSKFTLKFKKRIKYTLKVQSEGIWHNRWQLSLWFCTSSVQSFHLLNWSEKTLCFLVLQICM